MSDPQVELSPQGQDAAAYLETLIEEKKIEVPILPDVASRVLALSNDPDSDAAQLANLIQGDQALAGHVMRIANSAAYTPNASMVSLQQAIARLGMNLISDIAIAASLNAKLFKAPGFEARMAQIWDHALCAGLWGKEVARTSKRNVEAAFLCGLLHSIGRPAILQAVSEFKAKQGSDISNEEVLRLEEMFHVAVGKVIVKKWDMPIIVQESVRYYLNYGKAASNTDQAMVTNGAVKLAHQTLNPEMSIDEVLEDHVFSDLNLYDDDIASLKKQEEKVKSGQEAMRV